MKTSSHSHTLTKSSQSRTALKAVTQLSHGDQGILIPGQASAISKRH